MEMTPELKQRIDNAQAEVGTLIAVLRDVDNAAQRELAIANTAYEDCFIRIRRGIEFCEKISAQG